MGLRFRGLGYSYQDLVALGIEKCKWGPVDPFVVQPPYIVRFFLRSQTEPSSMYNFATKSAILEYIPKCCV